MHQQADNARKMLIHAALCFPVLNVLVCLLNRREARLLSTLLAVTPGRRCPLPARTSAGMISFPLTLLWRTISLMPVYFEP